jgi:2-polyprenyl-6-methoxyphenol hydroxylase-like FAD-dependent oxidoreductase
MATPTSSKGVNRRAVIIGGSMAGLFAAAFLRRIGWEVDLYERSSVELVGRGVGIFASHLELLEALDKCGAGIVDIGVTLYKRIALDRNGGVVAEKPLLQIVTSWDRLRHLLLKAIDRQHYHFGYVFERVDQDDSGVRVHFTNGRVEHADILVGCDGIRSSVRAQLAPDVQPEYAGYYIWRGAPDEGELTSDTRRSVFPYYTVFVDDQLQVLGYPISGYDEDLRPGHRRYNFAWYRVADNEKLREMCVDEHGEYHKFSVPPPLVRKDLILELRDDADRLLPPQFRDCLHHIARPFFTPVYDFCSPSLVFNRVVLVGDAASTARPHIGFGVAKAGAEAQALMEALRDKEDLDRALATYNRVRQPLSERIVQHARRLGTQLGVGIHTENDRKMAQLLQTPQGVLDWTSMPNFLAQT